MLSLRGTLSKSSRDALAAAETAKGLKPPPEAPNKEADEEVAMLMREQHTIQQLTSAEPYSGLASPSDARPAVWHGVWQADRGERPGSLSPVPRLSPAKLEAVAARTSHSKQKHVTRLKDAEEERRRPFARSPDRESASRRGARSPSPPASPMERPRSPLTVGERSDLSHAFEVSTSSRAIYIMERKAFGREPITNQAAPLRCAGTPRSPSPSTMAISHLDRVRSTLPSLAEAQLTRSDYYELPRPAQNLKKMAPKLSNFFQGAARAPSLPTTVSSQASTDARP